MRYKSIRALGLLARGPKIVVDRERVERLCELDLVGHFRVLGLRCAMDAPALDSSPTLPSPAERLLVALLGDKLRQSLERAFRLLKIAYPREDIHGVYLACLSGDAFARANAGEFLDALLTRRRQERLRALLRLIADDLPTSERASRAAASLAWPDRRSREDALQALVLDHDLTVAALAGIVALEIGGPLLRKAVDEARRNRPELEASAGPFFDDSTLTRIAAHG